MFDLIIKNGKVIDGSGDNEFTADVGIKDGKIAAVGVTDGAEAAEVYDASGKYVTPGFIDIHRHADAAALRGEFGEAELAQGLTTVVNGQCGLSLNPCPEKYKEEILSFLEPIIGYVDRSHDLGSSDGYFRILENTDLPLNVGTCVGNGTVRMATRGFESGQLSKEEMAVAKSYIKEGLDAGALGVTMGIVYAPENCYNFESFTEVLSPMRDYNVPLVTHIRGYGDILHKSLDEIVSIAKAVGVPLHVSHMMAVGKQNHGTGLNEALAILERAKADGMQISFDVYPYTAGASQLIQILPPWYQEGGVDKIVQRLSDKKQRAELVEILKKPQQSFENLLYSSGFDSLLITTLGLEKNKQYIGKTVAEIAKIQGKDPYDCAFDLLIEERCNVTMVIFITDEKDILNIIRHPYASIISDSIYPRTGLPHPRSYGSYPKVLSEYVRDKGVIELPQAIKKMTSKPASLYRIGKKGLLKEGYDADIAIFDLNNIKATATYVEPRNAAEGMDRVYISGKLCFADGKVTRRDGGKFIRRRD